MKKKRIFGLAGIAAVVLAAGAGIYYTTSHHGSKGGRGVLSYSRW